MKTTTPTILAMYSGGLDSVAMLFLLLTHPSYKDYHIHVHHIDIVNIENRAVAEASACDMSLKWFKHHYQFSNTRSSIKYDYYPQGSGFIPDTDITGFFAGYIACNIPNVEKIAYGTNIHDLTPTREQRTKRSDAIRQCFTNAEKIWPVGDLTKKQMYDMLPKELQTKFWSCRTPVYSSSLATPCLKCKTCQQLKQANITHPQIAVLPSASNLFYK